MAENTKSPGFLSRNVSRMSIASKAMVPVVFDRSGEETIDDMFFSLYGSYDNLEERCNVQSKWDKNSGSKVENSDCNSSSKVQKKTPQSVLDNLDEGFFSNGFDPIEAQVKKVAEWDTDEIDEKFMMTIEETDTDRDMVNTKLAALIQEKHEDLMSCTKEVTAIDLDLERAVVQISVSRYKINTSKENFTAGANHILKLHNQREQLVQLQETTKSLRTISEVFQSMEKYLLTDDFGAAAECAYRLIDTLRNSVYERFSSIQRMGAVVQSRLPNIKRKVDKALLRLCSRKFTSVEYAVIIKTYMLLDHMSDDMGLDIRRLENGSVEDDEDSLLGSDVYGGIEGLSQRVLRFQVSDIVSCLRTAALEFVFANQQKKQQSARDLDISSMYTPMDSLSMFDLTDISLEELYKTHVTPDIVASCILKSCESLVDIVHVHYLITQWHLTPFDERNEDSNFLHRCGISPRDHPTDEDLMPDDDSEYEEESEDEEEESSEGLAVGKHLDEKEDEDITSHNPFDDDNDEEEESDVLPDAEKDSLNRKSLSHDPEVPMTMEAMSDEKVAAQKPKTRRSSRSSVNGANEDGTHHRVRKLKNATAMKVKMFSSEATDDDTMNAPGSPVEFAAQLQKHILLMASSTSSVSAAMEECASGSHSNSALLMQRIQRIERLNKARLMIAYRQFALDRCTLWQKVIEALVGILESVSFTTGVGMDAFLSTVSTLEVMMKLGIEFCGSESLPLKHMIAKKSEEFFHYMHKESFQMLSHVVEAESWRSFPISLPDVGGILGLIRTNIDRNSMNVSCRSFDHLAETDYSFLAGFAKEGNPLSIHPIAATNAEGKNPFDENASAAAESGDNHDSFWNTVLQYECFAEPMPGGKKAPQKRQSVANFRKEDRSLYDPMIVTQCAVNGLIKYCSSYLQIMHRVPTVAVSAYHGLVQLFDYYLCAIFHGFIGAEERLKFMYESPNKVSSAPPDQARTFEELKIYIVNCMNAPIDLQQASSDTSGVADDAAAPSAVKRISSVLHEFSVVENCDPDAQFEAMNARIVAGESCCFAAEILNELRSKMLLLLPDECEVMWSTYVAEYLVVARQLTALLYREMCPELIDAPSILMQITDASSAWESRAVRDDVHVWVDSMVHNCHEVWDSLCEEDGNSVAKSLVKEQIWMELCQAAFDVFMEGFFGGKIRKCSQQGRANMTMDLSALQSGLDSIHSCRSPLGKAYVDALVKASYLTDDAMLDWIRNNYAAYAYRHLACLVSQTLTSMINSKKLKDGMALLDSLYEVDKTDQEQNMASRMTQKFKRSSINLGSMEDVAAARATNNSPVPSSSTVPNSSNNSPANATMPNTSSPASGSSTFSNMSSMLSQLRTNR